MWTPKAAGLLPARSRPTVDRNIARLRGKRIVPTETEEHVYGALSLPFIPPASAKAKERWR